MIYQMNSKRNSGEYHEMPINCHPVISDRPTSLKVFILIQNYTAISDKNDSLKLQCQGIAEIYVLLQIFSSEYLPQELLIKRNFCIRPWLLSETYILP